ncbi:unnamed protein product [Strongylus vulgaris]|uniref:Uncharacterized protein n=1 Tax=Strongylus vulgaris TaxID=40348 RepID=A0A3P7L0C2_STRVU|nr:unnamed protein product [Strongylus vulgaris]
MELAPDGFLTETLSLEQKLALNYRKIIAVLL